MNHYVYFITNEDKMKYIGVRSSECIPEKDDKYWGSSKYLPKDISETGVKEIVQVFDTRKEAVALEIYLHDKWNVAVNPWFYNRAKQTSTGFDTQGCTKENSPGIAAQAEKLRGRTKENDPSVAAQAEKLRGRTKENDPVLAARSERMLGRTKENHPGTASQAEKMKGRTKENDPGVAAMAEKMKGRTKENDPGMAAMAEKLKGRTKETHPSLAAAAERRRGFKQTEEAKAKISAATTGLKHPRADLKKYWFIHKLYGLVWCTRYYLRTHFNKPDHIRSLFGNNPSKSCAGWSLYKGDK